MIEEYEYEQQLLNKKVPLTKMRLFSEEYNYYKRDMEIFHNPVHQYIYTSLNNKIIYIIDIQLSRLPLCCVPLVYLDFDTKPPLFMKKSWAHKHLEQIKNHYLHYWCDSKTCVKHTTTLRRPYTLDAIYRRPNTLYDDEVIMYKEQELHYDIEFINNRHAIVVDNNITERVSLFSKFCEYELN